MRKIVIILILFFFNSLNATEIKFERIVSNLNQPWSISFIDEENIILTQNIESNYSL